MILRWRRAGTACSMTARGSTSLPAASAALWIFAFLCCWSLAGSKASAGESAADVEGSCKANAGAGGCSASKSRAQEFWAEMKKRGLMLKLKKITKQEKAFAGRPAGNRSAMVVSDDVFYGRAIMKIPRDALLSLETSANKQLRRELTTFLFEKRTLEKRYNVSGEEVPHLLSLAYPLIAESRDPDSVFKEWLDAAAGERLFVLELSVRQRRVLQGTSVEGAYDEMSNSRNMILHTSHNISYFKDWPMTVEEANWALAVIMRHARVVHPHQDVRETRHPRMYLFPLVELLHVQLHPNPTLAISFQEEIIVEDGVKEEEMVLQIARRDMPKGEEVFLWPGRMSNSEMVVRHGTTFQENPIGAGRNATQPPNWHDNPKSKIRQEYEKYNCSSLEAFELRVSPRGHPINTFVRCYRVSWFLSNGWYTPGFVNRQRELNKWPPPKKYQKEDWLAWTQADGELNRMIMEYCSFMRERLKDTMDAETAADFRASKDPADRLLWHMRSEETRSFKECIALAKTVSP